MSEQTTQEQIVEMDINLLRTFKDHPFKVTADYPMIQLKESIENCGILTPLLVRPLKDGSYEIISGHRRKHAAQMLGLKTVPVIIRKMGYDDAIVTMVDANLQRDIILPSEKAFAYGTLIIMEFGDGQVSGLQQVDASDFYRVFDER